MGHQRPLLGRAHCLGHSSEEEPHIQGPGCPERGAGQSLARGNSRPWSGFLLSGQGVKLVQMRKQRAESEDGADGQGPMVQVSQRGGLGLRGDMAMGGSPGFQERLHSGLCWSYLLTFPQPPWVVPSLGTGEAPSPALRYQGTLWVARRGTVVPSCLASLAYFK